MAVDTAAASIWRVAKVLVKSVWRGDYYLTKPCDKKAFIHFYDLGRNYVAAHCALDKCHPSVIGTANSRAKIVKVGYLKRKLITFVYHFLSFL